VKPACQLGHGDRNINGVIDEYICRGGGFLFEASGGKWTMKGDCEWSAEQLTFWDRHGSKFQFPQYTQLPPAQHPAAAQPPPAVNSGGLPEHSVMLVARLIDPWNVYENLHQHFGAFTSSVILRNNRSSTLVAEMSPKRLSTNKAKRGSHIKDLWRATFGRVVGPNESFFAAELEVPLGSVHSWLPSPARQTPLTKRCGNASIAMAYADWLRHALVGRGKWTATRLATDSSSNGRPFLLVFLTRNNNNLKRRMSNEAELVHRLSREATQDRPARAVQVIELSGLPVAEQFRVVMAADGIVGTHGAGLTWLLALSGSCSTVVEIKAEGNYHYENLAYLFGKPHVFAPGTYWGATQFTAKIAAVVETVDAAESRWRRCVGERVGSTPSMSADGVSADSILPHEKQLSQTMQASAGPPWKYFDYHQAMPELAEPFDH